MDDQEFEKLVGEALDLLPPKFAKRLENVAVVVADDPSPMQMKSVNLPPFALLFGLYQGIPITKRSNYSGALPDKITIFKNSILRVCFTPEEVREKVRSVVMHEIGHHFGLSDHDMDHE